MQFWIIGLQKNRIQRHISWCSNMDYCLSSKAGWYVAALMHLCYSSPSAFPLLTLFSFIPFFPFPPVSIPGIITNRDCYEDTASFSHSMAIWVPVHFVSFISERLCRLGWFLESVICAALPSFYWPLKLMIHSAASWIKKIIAFANNFAGLSISLPGL